MKRFCMVVLCTLIGITCCVSCQADPKGQEPGQNTPQVSAVPENPSQEEARNLIQITAGGHIFEAELYENPAADAFSKLLPVTLELLELNGNEKYHYFKESLPADPQKPGNISAGDVMLYGTDCLVLFYESFETAYRYTPLGKIADAAGLKEALGSGTVTVEFSQKG